MLKPLSPEAQMAAQYINQKLRYPIINLLRE